MDTQCPPTARQLATPDVRCATQSGKARCRVSPSGAILWKRWVLRTCSVVAVAPLAYFLGHWFFNHSSASSPKPKFASRISCTSIQLNRGTSSVSRDEDQASRGMPLGPGESG